MPPEEDFHAVKYVIKKYWKIGLIENHFAKDTNIFLEVSLKNCKFWSFSSFLQSSTCHVTIKRTLSTVRHVRSLERTVIWSWRVTTEYLHLAALGSWWDLLPLRRSHHHCYHRQTITKHFAEWRDGFHNLICSFAGLCCSSLHTSHYNFFHSELVLS